MIGLDGAPRTCLADHERFGLDVDDEMPAENEEPPGVPQIKTLKIRRLQGGERVENEGADDITWTWSESVQLDDDGREQTVFLWD